MFGGASVVVSFVFHISFVKQLTISCFEDRHPAGARSDFSLFCAKLILAFCYYPFCSVVVFEVLEQFPMHSIVTEVESCLC
jgi:hypothetical protein